MSDKYISRKNFLRLSGSAVTATIVSGFTRPIDVISNETEKNIENSNNQLKSRDVKTKQNKHELIVLNATPPKGTKSVKYFIDDIRVSEMTNEYAVQTNTEPIWKTLTDPNWFDSGKRKLTVLAETNNGEIKLEESTILIPERLDSDNIISLTGGWKFAAEADLKMGKEMFEGKSPVITQKKFR